MGLKLGEGVDDLFILGKVLGLILAAAFCIVMAVIVACGQMAWSGVTWFGRGLVGR